MWKHLFCRLMNLCVCRVLFSSKCTWHVLAHWYLTDDQISGHANTCSVSYKNIYLFIDKETFFIFLCFRSLSLRSATVVIMCPRLRAFSRNIKRLSSLVFQRFLGFTSSGKHLLVSAFLSFSLTLQSPSLRSSLPNAHGNIWLHQILNSFMFCKWSSETLSKHIYLSYIMSVSLKVNISGILIWSTGSVDLFGIIEAAKVKEYILIASLFFSNWSCSWY